MKIRTKIILIFLLMIIAIGIMAVKSNAATVKVTAETLNIRKEPSTSSKVVAMLAEGVKCELLGEEGDWYQIKYKTYTGYISKQYAKLVESSSNNTQTNTNNQTSQNTNTASNNTQTSNNSQTNQNNTQASANNQTNQSNTQTTNSQTSQSNTQTNSQTSQNQSTTQTNAEPTNSEEDVIVYKKMGQDTDIKILPLIHSTKLSTIKKDKQVILLATVTGWSYVQADSVSGWVRSSTLVESTKADTNVSDDNKTTTDDSTEKTAYVSENYVNLRKGAGTNYAIIKVLSLNTQITIIKDEGKWSKVKVGNDTGYISKEFISDTKRVTSRSSDTRTDDEENLDSNVENNQNIAANTNTTSTTNKNNTVTTTTDNSTNNSSDNKNTTANETNTSKNNKEENNTTSSTTQSNKTTIKGTDVVAYAKQYLGHKYVYGGDGSNGTFDCSGFTMYVYKHFGINLPHGANSQYNSGKGTKITKQSDLQIGDIVFINDYRTYKGIAHCGIYIGDDNIIDASTITYTVTISSLTTTLKNRFYAGLRLI